MQLSLKFQALACLALSSTALGAAERMRKETVAALYIASNDVHANSIVVHDIYQDGSIKYNKSYRTRGKGSANQITPQISDALRSEGSIVVHGNRLFHVNAGSNTIEMWDINPRDPTELTRVGEAMNTGGDFPASISVHPKTGMVCVANGGVRNGVQCFSQARSGLAKMPNTNRLLSFPQTTPPTYNDTLNSMSTALFSRDGSKLLVDVKGQAQQKNPGYLVAWDVNKDGSLSSCHETYPAPSKVGAINFGMSYFNDKEKYIVADPTVGAIVYDFSEGYGPMEYKAKNIRIPGQNTVCWASYASKSDTYFFSDFGAQIVFEMKIDSKTYESRLVNKFILPFTKTVNIDHRVVTIGDDQFLYQLAPFGSSLFVFDIQPHGRTKMIQSYNFSRPLRDDKVPFSQLSPQGIAYHLKKLY